VPPQCTMMRVGSTWREWEEGRCLVFDDSFEHEVRHTGGVTAGQRVVLLLRFWHPDLPPESWASTLRHAETQVAQQLIARLPEPTLEVRSSSIADGQFDDVDSDSSGVD
jgi:aspartyl/asparaginyl beta-hydroxylase (cupin superfamily)